MPKPYGRVWRGRGGSPQTTTVVLVFISSSRGGASLRTASSSDKMLIITRLIFGDEKRPTVLKEVAYCIYHTYIRPHPHAHHVCVSVGHAITDAITRSITHHDPKTRTLRINQNQKSIRCFALKSSDIYILETGDHAPDSYDMTPPYETNTTTVLKQKTGQLDRVQRRRSTAT